jgi:transposase
MDMWPAFMTAARNCLPQADVVHDRFHVSKYLTKVSMRYVAPNSGSYLARAIRR